MRFLFVDAVSSRSSRHIVGRRYFSRGEPLRYMLGGDRAEVATGALCEAIGQLASWLCLELNEFTARPVFLFAEQIEVLAAVPVGTDVALRAEIHSLDEESFRFSGEALVGDQVVQRLTNCGGYFMPLGDLEDPAVTKWRFAALTAGGLSSEGAEADPYAFAALPGETLELSPGEHIRTRRTFAATEPFYADHFPRFPVTPIVILNEMIGQTTLRMLGLGSGATLRPVAIRRIKIRSFVAPGDTCETVTKVVSIQSHEDWRILNASAEVFKAGRSILRGDYYYVIQE